MNKIKKSLDYVIDCIKHPKETARNALIGTILLLTTSGCGSIYMNGIRIDKREHSLPVTIGLITAGATGTYFAGQAYEIQRADEKRKEKRRDFYRSLPYSGGGRIGSGPGEE